MTNYDEEGLKRVGVEETPSPLTLALLRKIAQQERKLKLFNDVPLKCFSYSGLFWPNKNRNLSTLSGKELVCRFAHVICEEDKVVLCITTGGNIGDTEGYYDRIFANYLPGVPHFSVPFAMHDDHTVDWDGVVDQMWSGLGDGLSGFTLEPVLVPHSAEDLADISFFTFAGFPTPYAATCGLFLQYAMTDDGPQETVVTTGRFRKALMEKIHWYRDPGEDVMQALCYLENMPVRCVLSDDEVQTLKDGYEQVSEGLTCPGCVSSYGATVRLHDSIQYYWHWISVRETRMTETLHRNMLLLAKALLSSGSKLLDMPVRTLFEAAAFQSRKYHPIYIYELNLESALNLQDFKDEDITLSVVINELLARKDDMDFIYSSLYYLLVYPFV